MAEDALQRRRLEEQIAAERSWGAGPSDVVLLDRDALRERLTIPTAVAGLFSPHCARIQPAKLVTGLARGRGATGRDDPRALARRPRSAPAGWRRRRRP